ncbi:MAG: diguanylate cyclase [Magnetococcus sp. WYHC-3]
MDATTASAALSEHSAVVSAVQLQQCRRLMGLDDPPCPAQALQWGAILDASLADMHPWMASLPEQLPYRDPGYLRSLATLPWDAALAAERLRLGATLADTPNPAATLHAAALALMQHPALSTPSMDVGTRLIQFDLYWLLQGLYQHELGQVHARCAARCQSLESLVTRDAETLLYTLPALQESLRQCLSRSQRYREVVTLVGLQLNACDAFAGEQGSTVAQAVRLRLGRLLLEICRVEDIPGRAGPDSFLLIMPNTTEEAALNFFRRLIRRFKDGEHHGATFGVGITQSGPNHFLNCEELLEKNRACLERALTLGRTTPGFFIRRSHENPFATSPVLSLI